MSSATIPPSIEAIEADPTVIPTVQTNIPDDVTDTEAYLRGARSRGEKLRSYIQTLTGLSNVKVELTDAIDTANITPLGTDGIYVRITTREIPQPATDYPRPVFDRAVQHALALHEVGHALFTDFEAHSAALKDAITVQNPAAVEFLADLANGLEDGTVEYSLRTHLGETARNRLAITNHNLRQARLENATAAARSNVDVFSALSTAILDTCVADSTVTSKLVDEENDEWCFKNEPHREAFETLRPEITRTHYRCLNAPSPATRASVIGDFLTTVQAELFDTPAADADGQSTSSPADGQPAADQDDTTQPDGSTSSFEEGDATVDQPFDNPLGDSGQPGQDTASTEDGASDSADSAPTNIDTNSPLSPETPSPVSPEALSDHHESVIGDTSSPPVDAAPESPESPDAGDDPASAPDQDAATSSDTSPDSLSHSPDGQSAEGDEDGSNRDAPSSSPSAQPPRQSGQTSFDHFATDSSEADQAAPTAEATADDKAAEAQDTTEAEASSQSSGRPDSAPAPDSEFSTAIEQPSEVEEDLVEAEQSHLSAEEREAEEAAEQVENAGAMFANALEETDESIDTVSPSAPTTGDLSTARWQTIENDAIELTEILNSKLTDARKTRRQRGTVHGRPDSRQLWKTQTNNPRVMSRRRAGDDKQYRFVFIVDGSGSMGTTANTTSPVSHAEQSVVTTALSLENCGIETAILKFTYGTIRLLKPFGVAPALVSEHLLSGDSGGRTPLGKSLEVACDLLTGSSKDGHIIIATDDAPSDEARYEQALKECHFGVHSVLVDFPSSGTPDPQRAKQWYDTYVTATDSAQLFHILEDFAYDLVV